MNDIMIIDLYYSRNEQAIKEKEAHCGNGDCLRTIKISW